MNMRIPNLTITRMKQLGKCRTVDIGGKKFLDCNMVAFFDILKDVTIHLNKYNSNKKKKPKRLDKSYRNKL